MVECSIFMVHYYALIKLLSFEWKFYAFKQRSMVIITGIFGYVTMTFGVHGDKTMHTDSKSLSYTFIIQKIRYWY